MRMRRAPTRRRLAVAASAFAAAALAAGCVFDWGLPAASVGGDDGGIEESSIADRVVEAAPADGGGHACTRSTDCVATKQYCHFSDNQCGIGVVTGTCTAIPPCGTDEVCACDGKTYSSDCAAIVNGNDLDKKKNACAFDAGTQFQCGTHICDQDKEYCLVGSSPVTYDCRALPPVSGTCQPVSCACPQIMMLGCTCSGDPGSLTLTGCPP